MTRHQIIESGLLELYVIGCLEPAEEQEIEAALEKYPILRNELHAIEYTLEHYAQAHAIQPHGAVQPLLLATVDYVERLQAGEQPSSPPLLNENSEITEYNQWLERSDMTAPPDFGAMYAKIIAHEAEKLTAIVWLRYGAPDEIHTDEHERFLIVEGSCEITIDTTIHVLEAGDYLGIPLHVNHSVRVTSKIPCKIVLQRVAVR